MKEKHGLAKAKQIYNRPPKAVLVTKVSLAMIVLVSLCTSALAQEDIAEDWYKKGLELDRNGSWEEAVKAYDKAIEISPNNATYWVAKVPSLNMLESRYNESLEALNRAIQIDPENPRAWELRGSTLFQMKMYNESLGAYDKAIENIERYQGELTIDQTEMLSGIWLTKGVVFQQVGWIDESLKAIDKAIQISPENYDAWMIKGRALNRLGKFNESIDAFENAFKVAPSIPAAQASPWISKADVLVRLDKYEEAMDIYDKAIGLNYSNSSIDRFYLASGWRGKGNALAKLGKYNEALEAFNKSIELSPKHAFRAWIDRGKVLQDIGRYEESLEAYNKAIETAPVETSYKALIGKGSVLDKMIKHDEAIKAYNEALRINEMILEEYPLDGEVWYYKGLALRALGYNSEAKEAFAKANELGYTYET